MSHLIDQTAGRPAIAYVGETPWHGLGAEMPIGANMNDWRKAAGLDWEARLAPLQYKAVIDYPNAISGTLEENLTHDERVVMYRSDTGGALNVCSSRYQILQPAEVMDFYSDLCKEHGFRMETAGAIKDGKVIWALASTGEQARVRGNDVVNGFVLLSTSYDGSMATTARHTSVRVVCNNTLHIATQGKPAISITHRSKFNAEKTREALGIGTQWKKFEESAQAMSEKLVTPEQSVAFFLKVYHDLVPGERTLSEVENKSVEKTIARLSQQYLNAPGAQLPSAKGTVWGLVNAVTHDIDFERRSHTQDTRLVSAWYGDGANVKETAWEAAQEILAA